MVAVVSVVGTLYNIIRVTPGGGGGGLTQKCRTCMGWGGVFGTQNTKVTCTLLYNKGGVSIFYPESQKYKWYTHFITKS